LVVLQKCWYNKFLQVKSIACYNEATFLEHYQRIIPSSSEYPVKDDTV
jgi:hypothetical protein